MASAAVFLFTAGAALSFSVRCAGYGALAWDRALRRPSPAIATSQAFSIYAYCVRYSP